MSHREFDRMYRELSDLKAKESKFNAFKREFAAREANRARDARTIAEEHQKQISEILHDGRLESTRQLQEMRAKDAKLGVLQKEISKLRRNMARQPPTTNGARHHDWEPPSPNGGQSDLDLGLYSPLASPTPVGGGDVTAAHMAETDRLLRKATQAEDKAKKARMQVIDLKRQLTSAQAKVSSAEGVQAKLKRDVSSSLDVQRTLRDRITTLETSGASLKKKVKASDGAEKRFQEEQAISHKLRKDIELEYDQMLKDYELGKKESVKTKAALQKAETAKTTAESEVVTLKTTISGLRKTNTTLKEQCTKAVADLAGATTQLATLDEKKTKEVGMDKDSLKQAKESLKTAQNELKKTQGELKTAQTDLETANTQLKTSQKGQKQAEVELKTTQKEAKKTEAKLESTTSELKKSQADFKQAQADLKQAQADHKTAKIELQHAKDAHKKTEGEVSARNETISKLKREHEKALSATKSQIVELEDKLKKKVSSGSDTLKTLQAELFASGNDLRLTKSELANKTTTLDEITRTTKTDIDKLQVEKEAAEKEKRQAAGVIAAVEDQVKSLEKELASAQSKIATLQPEFNAVNTQIETLSADLATAKESVNERETEVATMTKTITTLEQDLAQALQELSAGADDKKKKGSAAVEAAKSRLKRCENKLKESEAKVKDLEAQLKLSVSKTGLVDKNADSKLKSITEKMEQAEKDKSTADSKLRSIAEKLEQAEKDKTTANDEVKALTEKLEEAERYKGVVIQAQKDAEEKSERLNKELKEEKAKVAKFSSPLGGMSTSNQIAKAITDDQQTKKSNVGQEAKMKKLEVAAKKKEKEHAKALAQQQAQVDALEKKLKEIESKNATSKSLSSFPSDAISDEQKVETHKKFQQKFGSLETKTPKEKTPTSTASAVTPPPSTTAPPPSTTAPPPPSKVVSSPTPQVLEAPVVAVTPTPEPDEMGDAMDDEWRSHTHDLISEFYNTEGFFGEAKCNFGGVKQVEEEFAEEFSDFKKGDFIKVFEKTEQGYYDGVVLMPGAVGGVFYPEEIKKLSADEAFAKAQAVVQSKSLSAEDLTTVLEANIGGQEYDVCIALYDYEPSKQSPNDPHEVALELELKTGQVLYLCEEENDGYAMAEFGDNKGLIPMNFVAFVANEEELYDESPTVTCHVPTDDGQHNVVNIPKDKLLGIRPPEV